MIPDKVGALAMPALPARKKKICAFAAVREDVLGACHRRLSSQNLAAMQRTHRNGMRTLLVALVAFQSLSLAVSGAEAQSKISEAETAIKAILLAAEKGNAEAQYLAGALFDVLVVKPSNFDTAMGRRKLDPSDVSGRLEAMKWYRKAAQQNHAEAEYRAGFILFVSNEPGDKAESVRFFAKAADQEHAEAQWHLAIWYERGTDPKASHEHTKWLLKAAHNGHALAQLVLGRLYYQGEKGLTKDHDQAGRRFREAAAQGDAEAQRSLAGWYLGRDDAEAFNWAKKAALQGDTQGQTLLAFHYKSGNGVPQNYLESVKWALKAAEKGDADAQTMLGHFYLQGNGVEKDFGEAVRWFRKGAVQGNARAQGGLGACYYHGDGVPQDFVAAYMWFNLAAAAGDKVIRSVRDGLLERMSPAQITEGQKRASEFQAQVESTDLNSIRLSYVDPQSREFQARTKREATAAEKFEVRVKAFMTEL
ncbi:MAG: sel1 repeat family protein [Verrucomicrobia bacterium]|nr:sel1 repeat family protein [Verrucomicrobiota bacterium]